MRLKTWFEENGGKMPKLEYPATFEHGLLGVRCKEDVHHREACFAVPLKLIISAEKVRHHDVLETIIAQHKEAFSNDFYVDDHNMMLALALVYEMSLGEASFWHPYIEVLPDFTSDDVTWTDEDLDALQDKRVADLFRLNYTGP